MAARLNPRQDERCRSSIQTTQLCKRLNAFALGQPDPMDGRNRGKSFEMSELQLRAAFGLLRKTIPDLSSTQIESIGGGSGNHLHFHLEAAMRVSAELQGQAKRIVTLEPQAQDAPPASLLDAPLPEE
jgi:hypothetical protein